MFLSFFFRQITKLSIQNSIPSEYTHMIIVQKDSVKDDTSKVGPLFFRFLHIILILSRVHLHLQCAQQRRSFTQLTQYLIYTLKQAKKHGSNKRTGPEERLPILVNGLAIGFGNISATQENLPTGFGELKPPEALEIMFTKAAGCCGGVADCCCCMCLIQGCSKLNDKCFIVITQLFTALAFLGCLECCSGVCCNSSDS